MLKRLVNEARFTLVLETAGPVLVKSGYATVSGPDMSPVLTYRNGAWQPYLPGSSLKGVIRSHVEKVARTLNPTPGVICNPFQDVTDVREEGQRLVCTSYPDVSCGHKLQWREGHDRPRGLNHWRRDTTALNPQVAYAESCPACRLFGSTSFIGRVSISDAYPAGDNAARLERRDGVGIDRLTGGAAHGAKFNLQAISSGVSFTAEIALRNFECWQLGALMVGVTDLRDGLIRIGYGRSRGLGAVRGDIGEGGVEVDYVGLSELPEPNQVWGLGRFLADGSYGTEANDVLAVHAQPKVRRQGVRVGALYSAESLQSLSDAAVMAFVDRIKGWPVPAGMTWEALGWRREGGG
jgi:CRISPR-associated RAMP protein (TIGR02581 family)